MVGKLAPSMRDVWPIFDLSFPPSAPPLHDLVAQTLCEAMRTLRECVRRGGGSSGDLDRLLSLWHEHGLTASVELYKEAMQVMEGWSARGGASRGEADALLAIMKVAGVRAEQETMRSYLKIVENELMAWRTKQGNEGEKAEAEMRSALAHLDCLLHTVIADDRLLRLLIAFLKRNWEALQQLDPTLSLSLLQLARDSSKLMADPLLRTQARSLLLPASASPPQLRSSPVASAKEAWKSAGKTRGQPEEVREGRTRGDDGPSLQRMSWMLPEEERGREGDQEQEGADNEFKAKLEKLKERFSNGDLDLWQFTEEKEELLFEYGKEFLPKGASERVKSMKIADIKQRIQSKRERSERADQQQQKGWKEEEEEESLKFPTESEWEDHPTAWGRHSSSSGEEEEEGGTGRRREEEAGLSVSHVSSDDKADELVLKESLARCRVCRRRRDYCLCHTAEPSAPSSASSSPSTDSSVETSWEDELSDL
uniref:Uncharacterized protein n=1 Tax=Guillardia theta TaxID=55529 RepID=A0A7S4N0A6_GUITH